MMCTPWTRPTALVFVRVVSAVVVVVALPAARHTAIVLAAELVRLARPLSCTHQRTPRDNCVVVVSLHVVMFLCHALLFVCACVLLSSPHSSLGSSDESPQSSSPSHFQRAGMQRPESLQRNSSTPHVIWAAGGGEHSGYSSKRALKEQSG